MSFKTMSLTFVAATLMLACGTANLSAHGIFKKTLEKKYDDLRVTCYMCHLKGEPKTTRNDFGQLFHEEMKEMELSKNWNERELEERKEYEQEVMAPAILEALEEILKKENEDGEKYSELIPNGKIEGSKKKK